MDMPSRIRRATRESVRFLVAGIINTACTFALYWLLLPTLSYAPAYTVSFVSGIALSYFLHSMFVFRTGASVRSAILFPSVYLAQYLVGLVVLWIWVDLLDLPVRYGVFATALASLPVTFLVSRSIMKRG